MLLERERETALLRESVEGAAAGTGRIVFVEGDPGIGKTTLVRAARAVAGDLGVRTLRASGAELERDLTFGVARQVLEACAREAPGPLLAGAARHAGPLLGVGETEAPGDEPSLVHALFWACANLAAQAPLYIEIDDAHWADAASLRWLVYLARRLDELPVALVVAARSGEPDAPQDLLDLLEELAGTGRSLRPAPLTAPASEALVRSEAGAAADEELCRTVHAMARGNPLLVRQAASVAAEGRGAGEPLTIPPAALSRTVLRRLDRLPAPATALVRAVAVLDRDAALATAASLAGAEPAAAAEAADRLVEARILEPGRPLSFVHPVVRSALYEAIPAGERSRLHARAARLLADAGVPPARAVPHLLAAEPLGDAATVRILRAAAAVEPDPRRAVAALRRALAEPPPAPERAATLLALGQAETRAYDSQAIEHLTAGREASADPAERLAATQALARAWTLDSRPEAALGWVREELAALEGDDGPHAGEVRLALRALEVIRGEVTPDQAAARRAEAAAAATPAQRYLLAALAYKATDHGTAADAAELAELALQGGLQAEGIRGTGATLVIAALMNADELERAAEVARGALASAQEAGDVSGRALALTLHADVACRRGALADAEAESREALELAEKHTLAWAEPVAIATLVEALGEQGRGADADAVLAERELTEWQQGTARAALYRYGRGRLRLAQGRPAEALEDFRAAGEVMRRYGVDNPAVAAWRAGAAEALLRLGDEAAAQALADEELELARPFSARHAIGASLRVRGLARGGEAARADLHEAVELLAGSPSRLLRAQALVDLGAALRRAGERAAAREPLRTGLDLAHRCGASQLADRAEQELAASGARPRRRAVSGHDALTPSQLRIARQAADGLSNREIAQALFLSVRTVENQLRQVYFKLDLGSRRELAGALMADPAQR